MDTGRSVGRRHKTSLVRRLQLIGALLGVVPLLVGASAAAAAIASNRGDILDQAARARADVATQSLANAYENLSELMRVVVIDPEVQRALRLVANDDVAFFRSSQAVRVVLERVAGISSLIDGLLVIGTNDLVSATRTVPFEVVDAIRDQGMPEHASQLSFTDTGLGYRSIYGDVSGLPAGRVFLILDLSAVRELLGPSADVAMSVWSGDGTELIRLDPAEDVGSASGSARVGLPRIRGQLDVEVFGRTQIDALRSVWYVAAALSVAVGVSVIILGEYLIRRHLTPVEELAAAMRDVSAGDLSVRARVVVTDEIGYLAETFNTMADRVGELVEQLYDEQSRRMALQVRSITEQIRPHFLYNALDGASALAQMGNTDLAFRMIRSLSSFYRSVLSSGRDIVSLNEELGIARSYLDIQRIRYPAVLEYAIDATEDARRMSMVKLTLQPLVENAIYHGIKPKGTEGRIWIHADVEARGGLNWLVLGIEDDGVGLGPGPSEGSGFALPAVRERLTLSFGKQASLKIADRAGGGTMVRIVCPARIYADERGSSL